MREKPLYHGLMSLLDLKGCDRLRLLKNSQIVAPAAGPAEA